MEFIGSYTMYICPRASVEYEGICPIKTCPSNIGKQHASGCANISFNKDRLNVPELAHVFKESSRSIKSNIQLGSEAIIAIAQLIKEVENTNLVRHCSCGERKDKCAQDEKHLARIKTAKRVKKEIGNITNSLNLSLEQIAALICQNKGKRIIKSIIAGN